MQLSTPSAKTPFPFQLLALLQHELSHATNDGGFLPHEQHTDTPDRSFQPGCVELGLLSPHFPLDHRMSGQTVELQRRLSLTPTQRSSNRAVKVCLAFSCCCSVRTGNTLQVSADFRLALVGHFQDKPTRTNNYLLRARVRRRQKPPLTNTVTFMTTNPPAHTLTY